MISTETNNRVQNAATRNVNLMANEVSILGYVSPELWSMVLDEERTQATEILTHQEDAYGVVPRSYRKVGNSLKDRHNQDLVKVIDDGVDEMRRQQSLGVPGADWELDRRLAERNNAATVLNMVPGTVCAEVSASPYDKPKEEQQAQHYTDLTMMRLSHKVDDDTVIQYNYVLPVSSPEFLSAIQDKLGRATESQILDSTELLANPIFEKVNQTPEQVAKRYDSLIGAALLEASVGHSAVRMIKKAIENRKEAWEFVNSKEHEGLDHELLSAMVIAAKMAPGDREKAMDAIRSGYWKELKDRFKGNAVAAQKGGIIMAAASRAVVAGDVFIACGSTVHATEFSNEGNGVISRSDIVKSLRDEVRGNGNCSACGAKGNLYGCGLCVKCNDKWCSIFELTGEQTEIKNLSYLNYSRPAEQSDGSPWKGISDEWRRITHEVKQKQELKKLHQAKMAGIA